MRVLLHGGPVNGQVVEIDELYPTIQVAERFQLEVGPMPKDILKPRTFLTYKAKHFESRHYYFVPTDQG
jgi:hypothetical protein